MKTECFPWRLAGLAAVSGRNGLAQAVSSAKNLHFQRCRFLGFAVLGLLLSGCATHRGTRSQSSGISSTEGFGVSRFGIIALAEESGPASFSFQKAKGKLGTATQAILDSATVGLSGPGAGVIASGTVLSQMDGGGDPYGSLAMAGLVGGVAAVGAALAGPVVGAEGLIRSWKSVSPAELAEREAALTDALRQMAGQKPFRDALLQTGAERISGGFLLPDPKNTPGETASGVTEAILEARVDDLRLERAGSSEGSYFLLITTRARVVRVSDGAICFQERAEYRSDTALFLDWTLHGAIQGVAETGYRALARHYVDQLLVGSGFHSRNLLQKEDFLAAALSLLP